MLDAKVLLRKSVSAELLGIFHVFLVLALPINFILPESLDLTVSAIRMTFFLSAEVIFLLFGGSLRLHELPVLLLLSSPFLCQLAALLNLLSTVLHSLAFNRSVLMIGQLAKEVEDEKFDKL